MDVIDMVRRQLVAMGADGLARPGHECGCGLKDLAPCADPLPTDCVAARHVARGGSRCAGEECEYWEECAQVGEGCHAPMEEGPPQKPPVRVALAVWDWIDPARPASVYSTEDGVEYGIGDMHSGTVFRGSLELSAEDADTIRAAAAKGHQPLFRLMLEDGDGAHHGR